MGEKAELRKKMATSFMRMEKEALLEESARCSKKISELLALYEFSALLFFMPLQTEPNILPVLQNCLANGKLCALPRIKDKTGAMDFYRLDTHLALEAQLEKNAWGIAEPFLEEKKLLLPKELCKENVLALVPGVAFSKEGLRLGHGKGYYDRYLAHLGSLVKAHGGRLYKAGVCFSYQIVPALPFDEHDVRMDSVIFP